MNLIIVFAACVVVLPSPLDGSLGEMFFVSCECVFERVCSEIYTSSERGAQENGCFRDMRPPQVKKLPQYHWNAICFTNNVPYCLRVHLGPLEYSGLFMDRVGSRGPGRTRVIGPDPTRVTGPDPTRPDPTRPDPTRPDPTRPDPTRPDPTRPDPTRPDPGDRTRPDPTRPDRIRSVKFQKLTTQPVRFRTLPDPTGFDPRSYENLLTPPAGRVLTRD